MLKGLQRDEVIGPVYEAALEAIVEEIRACAHIAAVYGAPDIAAAILERVELYKPEKEQKECPMR